MGINHFLRGILICNNIQYIFFFSSIRSHTDEHRQLFIPQYRRAEVTEKEFHALSALVLTEYGTYFIQEKVNNQFSRVADLRDCRANNRWN